MLKLLSALAIAAFMAVAGSSAYAAPAVSSLDSLKSSEHSVVLKAYYYRHHHHHHHCWYSHGHRHCN
jgi:hypothetical protein